MGNGIEEHHGDIVGKPGVLAVIKVEQMNLVILDKKVATMKVKMNQTIDVRIDRQRLRLGKEIVVL